MSDTLTALSMITLRNDTTTVRITNLGCAIVSIETPDRNGICRNIVAGYATAEAYHRNPWYFGCIVGRYANRISRGQFILDGHQVQLSRNNDGNHLHGGYEGFHKKIWDIIRLLRNEEEESVLLSYTSIDGEEGYPGTVMATVSYTLTHDNRLKMEYRATADHRTVINLTNHSYFNLTGFDTPWVTDHLLQVNAQYYTEKGADNLPTGRIIPVSGSPLDFLSATPIGRHIKCFPIDKGFDHNFVLDHAVSEPTTTDRLAPDHSSRSSNLTDLTPAAELSDPLSGRVLRLYTDQPGLQVYTANWWDGTLKGAHALPYVQHGAVALETQAFPDSPNHPGFPDTSLSPGDVYQATTILEFDCKT